MQPAKLSHRLTTQDASFLYGESESAPLHFSGLATFEGSIDFAKLRHYMERRLPLLPRFRQRLVFAPLNLAYPALADDPDFKISNHLFHHQLPEGSNEAALRAAALRIFEPLMDRSRPLWEMHLFTGLEGERSAVLWRIHHCIVDGVSWVEILNVMLEPKRDAVAPAPLQLDEPKPLPNSAERLLDAAHDLASTQLRAVRRIMSFTSPSAKTPSALAAAAHALGALLRPTVLAPWNEGMVTKSRAMAWLRFPLEDVCSIRNAFGGTMNDVALSALSEGAARYLQHHKSDRRRTRLRIGCPVSVRSHDEMGTLGNRVSMMIPELNAAPMDPVARLNSVCEETRRLKSSNEAQAADLLMNGADLVPPLVIGLASSLATRAIDSAARLATRAPMIARMLTPRVAAINFIATNIAGPRGPVYLAGHRMLDYVGMIPLGGNLGYGVVIATYNQNLYFGMMAASDLMPDIETMKFYVGEAFEELALAAKKQLGSGPVTVEVAAHPEAA
jgi:WS/DGAT/MGAT family acyltransferase